jgi:hypothetical protein
MKQMVLCLCNRHMVNVHDATYVLHGKPACARACYERAVNEDVIRQHRRAEAYALRNGINRQRVAAYHRG